jgi:hypothetical protein
VGSVEMVVSCCLDTFVAIMFFVYLYFLSFKLFHFIDLVDFVMVQRINVPKTNLSVKGIRQLIKPLIELKLQLFLLPNEKKFSKNRFLYFNR